MSSKEKSSKRVAASRRPLTNEAIQVLNAKSGTLFKGNGERFIDSRKAIRQLSKVDSTLGSLIKRVGVFDLKSQTMHTPFGALAEAIIYQQITGRAAAAIHARVVQLFHSQVETLAPEHILGATEEQLRGAGLSRGKTLALKDLAAKTLEGVVPTLEAMETMDDEAIIARLLPVRGVGRWTAEMLLIFRLGRPDVLPVGDYAIRKAFGLHFREGAFPTPREVTEYGECWRPYRTVASWYLWRSLSLPRA
ncbi:MAG: DNA-3-methyladenine glycosylase [Pyrinomonadaceae bacterium]